MILSWLLSSKKRVGVYFDEVAGKYVHLYNSIGIPCHQSLYRYDIEDNNDTDDEEPYETELENDEFKQFRREGYKNRSSSRWIILLDKNSSHINNLSNSSIKFIIKKKKPSITLGLYYI